MPQPSACTATPSRQPYVPVDDVAIAARQAVEVIKNLHRIREPFLDGDDAAEIRDTAERVTKAFANLLCAIWKDAGGNNILSGSPPSPQAIIEAIDDCAGCVIDPDLADGGRGDALNIAVDMRLGK